MLCIRKHFALFVLRKPAQKAHQDTGGGNAIFLELLKRVAESGFALHLGSRETGMCFPMAAFYCCDTLEDTDGSIAPLGAERQHSCTRCRNTYENMMIGGGSSGRVLAETMGTQRRLKEMQQRTENLA